MADICTAKQAIESITEGMTLMIGGFLGVGTPEGLVQALVEQGTENLTVICNDTAFPGKGVGKLQDNRQISKLYASYIGGHPGTGKMMESGEMEVILVPQGSLAEKIRAAGSGLGGFLTPTGVGTIVAQDKQEVSIKGKTHLLELPLYADVALLKAYKADQSGNLIYRLSARNFNPLMAMAAKRVIVEVEEMCPMGLLDPDHIITPGIFVDCLVKEGS